MKKLQELYTQKELEQLYTSGKTQVFTFRKAFQLMHSEPCGYYLIELERYKATSGLPYTGRGRHLFTTVKHGQQLVDIAVADNMKAFA